MSIPHESVIFKIANRVRKKFEGKNPEADLFCKCGIASAELSLALLKAGIEHQIRYATKENEGGHVFIVVGDKMLLDLTAKQFDSNLPRIVYRELKTPERHWWWKTWKRYDTPEELVAAQKKEGWPRSQIHPKLLKKKAA